MGHNVDLEFMLGAPSELRCPRCRKMTRTFFDDYDIDCGNPNPAPGKWELDVYCSRCEHEFVFERDVKLKKTAAR
jgi:hypothetical protein